MQASSFGIDIGGSTMKAVWLSREKDGFYLNASFIAPTPTGGMLSESPFDQEQMAGAIRKVVADAQITSKYVNVALAEHQVYTKVIEMPSLSDKELSSAIYWEAEQYIPVPLSTVNLVWNVLKRPEKAQTDEKMLVLLVGAPITLIEKHKRIFAMAGLVITSMETEILATIRPLSYIKNFPASVIINIGSVSSSLAIVKDNILIFNYTIPFGGVAINRAIAADFGLTPQQAEEYKKVYGIGTNTVGERIGKATEPILQAILVEVKKALAYYEQKYKNDPVQQIVLAGGTAKLPGIDIFFAKNSGIETVIANPWKVLVDQNLPKEILANAADYTTAVGLAMRAYEE